MGFLLWGGLWAQAQIGEHRNDFSIGFNCGYVLSSVGFEPEVQQKQHGGMICRTLDERYLRSSTSRPSVPSMQRSWMPRWDQRDILDIDNQPVIITGTSSRWLDKAGNYQLYPGTCFRSLGLG